MSCCPTHVCLKFFFYSSYAFLSKGSAAADEGKSLAFHSFPALLSMLSIAPNSSPNKVSDRRGNKLPVPSTEDRQNRSTSPSPDMIKGAGTTPILPVPDPGFGEDSGIDESTVSRGNSPSPAVMRAPLPSGENSPFGQPMEASPFAVSFGDSPEPPHKTGPPARPPLPPQEPIHAEAPSRPPPPTSFSHNENMFGSNPEFGEHSGESVAPPRPAVPSFANIPFASLDPIQQQYIIQQQLLLQQQQKAMSSPQLQQKPPKKASAFEDLDLAMRSTMAKPPKPVGAQPQQETTASPMPPGMVYIPPGCVPPAGFVIIPGMPSYGIAAGAAGLPSATEGFLYFSIRLFLSSLYLFLSFILFEINFYRFN